MTAKYAFQNFDEHTVKASGASLPISTKVAIEVCNRVRGKTVEKATTYLENVIAKKQAVAFTRFMDGVGHRRGPMASGRFPIKTATHILAIIKSAQANAQAQNFNEALKIVHLSANRAPQQFHQGRQRRREMKRTHIQVVLKEVTEEPVAKKATKKTVKTETKKEAPVEAKPESQSAKETTEAKV